MEWFIIIAFCIELVFFIMLDISIIYALIFGLMLFLFYGRYKKISWSELASASIDGVKTVKNILITFVLIGMLTSFWRAAGTIPTIVSYASILIRPSIFIVITFFLNCFISFLTGTSFGTAATMGVICATMGNALGIDIRLIGGAVLSGIYFGDRCSPVSTSALLVCELTKTNIFDNIKTMTKTSIVPFIITSIIYLVIGLKLPHSGEMPNLLTLFEREFSLNLICILPAVVIFILSGFRVNVKLAMSASIICAIPICLLIQDISIRELSKMAVFGYTAADNQVGQMLNGGGIASMVKVACIVSISSSYSGIFNKTGLLDNVKLAINKLSQKTNSFTAILVTSIFTGIVACNQTLCVLLTNQLCDNLVEEPSDLAIHLENTAIVIAPLIPWSIAGAVPLASIGSVTSAVLFACYLYILPLWQLLISYKSKPINKESSFV